MTSYREHIDALNSPILPVLLVDEAESRSKLLNSMEGTSTFSKTERDDLLTESLPIVHSVARSIHVRLPRHIELDELISAGTVGLVDAVGKFDPYRCVQFKTYAKFRIHGAILDFLRSSDWSPRELRRKGRAVTKAFYDTSSRLGCQPTASDVAAELGIRLDAYQHLLGELDSTAIDSLNAEDKCGNELLPYLAAPAANDPLFQCLRGEMRARVAEAIDNLPEKERLVLTLYYDEDQTMKEVGYILGVVESRVCQLHASGVRRLRISLGLTPVKSSMESGGLGQASQRNSYDHTNYSRMRPQVH